MGSKSRLYVIPRVFLWRKLSWNISILDCKHGDMYLEQLHALNKRLSLATSRLCGKARRWWDRKEERRWLRKKQQSQPGRSFRTSWIRGIYQKTSLKLSRNNMAGDQTVRKYTISITTRVSLARSYTRRRLVCKVRKKKLNHAIMVKKKIKDMRARRSFTDLDSVSTKT